MAISGVGDGETGAGPDNPWVSPFELRIFCDSLKPHKANLSILSDTRVCFIATIWRGEGKICGFALSDALPGKIPTQLKEQQDHPYAPAGK